MESNSTTELPTLNGEKRQTRLVDVPLNTQQDALQLIVTFLNLAQKRGAFSLKEAHTLQEALDKLSPHAAPEGEQPEEGQEVSSESAQA